MAGNRHSSVYSRGDPSNQEESEEQSSGNPENMDSDDMVVVDEIHSKSPDIDIEGIDNIIDEMLELETWPKSLDGNIVELNPENLLMVEDYEQKPGFKYSENTEDNDSIILSDKFKQKPQQYSSGRNNSPGGTWSNLSVNNVEIKSEKNITDEISVLEPSESGSFSSAEFGENSSEVSNSNHGENWCNETASTIDGNQDTDCTLSNDPSNSADDDYPEFEQSECTIDCYIARKEFFFETDHPALKANSDYRKLLYIVLELEAKRAKAIRDLEVLRDCRNRAMADPIGFVAKLQRGEDIGIPNRQKIPEIPAIDWNKYAITNTECGLSKRQLTRHSARVGGNDLINILARPGGPGRGRKSRQEPVKQIKLSQPWSNEEQKKLEELLIKYPPEDIESRRWEKIANELENRTPTQVASRVQKYFIKLLKAGMPIPGRQPNSSYLRKPRRQVMRQQPSTFFPSYNVPVSIDEDDIKMSNYGFSQPPSDEEEMFDVVVSDDDDVPADQHNTPEYMELMCIKKAMRRKRNQYIVSTTQHIGYKCSRCGCDPIIGVRWHCTECPPSVSVDFCGDCVDSMHETEHHSAVHKMEAVRHASAVTGFDSDYSYFTAGDYNYLDPNYMPAT